MSALSQWPNNDVHDRQNEMHSIANRNDELSNELGRLGSYEFFDYSILALMQNTSPFGSGSTGNG